MNKTGPILLSKDFHSSNMNNKKSSGQNDKKVKDEFKNDFKSNSTSKPQVSNFNNKAGFTLGIKPGVCSLRTDRRERMKIINEELNGLFKTNVCFYRSEKKEKKRKNFDSEIDSRSKNKHNLHNVLRDENKKKRNYDDLYKLALERRQNLDNQKLNKLNELKEKQEEQSEQYQQILLKSHKITHKFCKIKMEWETVSSRILDLTTSPMDRKCHQTNN